MERKLPILFENPPTLNRPSEMEFPSTLVRRSELWMCGWCHGYHSSMHYGFMWIMIPCTALWVYKYLLTLSFQFQYENRFLFKYVESDYRTVRPSSELLTIALRAPKWRITLAELLLYFANFESSQLYQEG